MALNSYSALKTSIANWLNRSDLTSEISNDFIKLTENYKLYPFPQNAPLPPPLTKKIFVPAFLFEFFLRRSKNLLNVFVTFFKLTLC